MLATALERFDEAEEHFETALAVDGRVGARAWQAYTRLDYARMCLARGGAKARARANQYLRDACKLARELGIASIEHEATALLE